jgi:hypothetical protein
MKREAACPSGELISVPDTARVAGGGTFAIE